jgi:hypothetical protein
MPTLRGSRPDWLDNFNELPATLRTAALQPVSSQPKRLDRESFPLATRLVARKEIDAAFASGGDGWDSFRLRFNSAGWIGFSDVIFTDDGRDALVYYEIHCGWLCGFGRYVWLQRDRASRRSVWSIKKTVDHWVS